MTLTCFYDLARCPPTYDFVSFLLACEAERRRVGADDTRIVFLPGPVNGFRDDPFWPPPAERENVFNRIVLPMCRLLRGVIGVERPQSRRHRAKYAICAASPSYGLDVFIKAFRQVGPVLRAPSNARLPKLVTITLREAEHWPERNSNVAEWTDTAGAIRKMGYHVTVRRDASLVPWPLYDRAALYAGSFCNLFVNNGPAWLSFALGAPTVMLKPTCEASGYTASAAYLASCGLPRGSQLPGAGPHQRIVWREDSSTAILGAFEDYVSATQVRASA
jgi:hypothetical protein